MRVIALHGFLGLSQDFSAVEKVLRERQLNLQFYAPNFFTSTSQAMPTSFKEWPQVFETQVLPKAPFRLHSDRQSPRFLLGYSFGGRLALDLFLSQSDLFDGLIILGAHPGGGLTDSEKSARRKNDFEWAEKITLANWQSFTEAWNLQAIFHQGSRATAEPTRFVGDYSLEKLQLALKNLGLAEMRTEMAHLAARAAKTHWLAGELDEKVRLLYERLRLEGVIQNLHVVKDSGHRLIFDQPRAVAEQILHIAERFEL